MIDHDDYRRAMLADPERDDPELRAHRADCAACRAFTGQLFAFEAKLVRALKEDVQPTSAARPARSSADILPFKPRGAPPVRRPRWLAVAASVTVALVVVSIAWLGAPRSSLAADVVAHMAGEPGAWNTRDAVPASVLEPILKRAHLRLKPDELTVSYANPCTFRGQLAPHLVVQSRAGPVTVMVLTQEPLSTSQHFDEQGYRGTLVPMPGHGSLAVLMKSTASTATDVDAVAALVRSAIVWSR
jgi:hypothetical protein